MIKVKATITALAISAALLIGPSRADTMLVLDASNSMWGEIGGAHKIDIAKDTINSIMTSWPEDEAIGMIAYGHRRKSDCSDIEELVPIAPGSAPFIAQMTLSLSPKGKTPLSDAVLKAADHLKYLENKATVILVTDGVETCDRDPCALGTELEKQGIDFTAHVIGFDMSLEAQASVSCLAHNTGGLFLPAGDAGELSAALGEVSDSVEEQPVAMLRVAQLSVPARVPASSAFSADWLVEEAVSQVRVMLVPVKGGPNEARQSINSLSTSRVFTAPNELGMHEVIIWDGTTLSVLAREAFQVVPSETTISAPATVLADRAFEISWTGPKAPSDRIHLSLAANPAGKHLQSINAKSGQAELIAPSQPGSYEIRYFSSTNGEVLATASFDVEASGFSLTTEENLKAGQTFMISWGNSKGAKVDRIAVAHLGDPKPRGLYSRSASGRIARQMKAPKEPGIYEVRYIGQGDQILAMATIEVK